MSDNLPNSNEPLRLADGRLVYPGGDIVDTHARAGESRVLPARVRRRAADLPAPFRQMNAIAAVVCYVLYGMDDEEIAEVTKLSVIQVGNIKQSDPYQQMYDAIMRAAMDHETDVVRELLGRNAKRAASTLVDALDA